TGGAANQAATLLEEAGRQRTAVASDGRNLQEDVLRDAFARDARMAPLQRVAVGNEQLRVVERRALIPDARIGQRPAQKRDEIVDLLRSQIQFADLEVDVQGVVFAEVAAAIVELHDLADSALSAVVEVRRGQLEVAKVRYLERALGERPLADRDRRIRDRGDRERQQLLRRNGARR